MTTTFTAPVESLGWVPVKGTTWHQEQELRLTLDGVPGDRLWSPISPQGVCLKATDVPELAGVRVETDELPGPDEHLVGGPTTLHYYDRVFPGTKHGGPVAERLSEAVGRPVLLGHTTAPRGFVWASPVSVLLRSELDQLPTDTGRYRPNVVLDDRDAPLHPEPGDRLRLGEVLLEVEHELDRCLVINHNPVTGRKDQSLLKRLRPGLLLAYGCRVVEPGTVRVG